MERPNQNSSRPRPYHYGFENYPELAASKQGNLKVRTFEQRPSYGEVDTIAADETPTWFDSTDHNKTWPAGSWGWGFNLHPNIDVYYGEVAYTSTGSWPDTSIYNQGLFTSQAVCSIDLLDANEEVLSTASCTINYSNFERTGGTYRTSQVSCTNSGWTFTKPGGGPAISVPTFNAVLGTVDFSVTGTPESSNGMLVDLYVTFIYGTINKYRAYADGGWPE